jgi:hypothetical protein
MDKKHVGHAIYDQTTKIQARDPRPVLPDIALQCAVERPPDGKQDEDRNEVSRAKSDRRAQRNAAVDKQCDDCCGYHEGEKACSKESVQRCTLAAEEQYPSAHDQREQNGYDMSLNQSWCVKYGFKGHGALTRSRAAVRIRRRRV